MKLAYIVVPLLLLSCVGSGKPKTENTIAGPPTRYDSLVVDDSLIKYTYYSEKEGRKRTDSMKYFYRKNRQLQAVYYQDHHPTGVLFRTYYFSGKPEHIEFDGEELKSGDTLSISYYENGSIQELGLLQDKKAYDALGIKYYKSGGESKLYKLYYTNGQLKQLYLQGDVYVSGACLGMVEWDSLGHKTNEYVYDYRIRKGWESYNERFCVTTTTAYYPNGKVKQVSKTKSFVESGECPCGRWDFFNEKGQKIRSEQHKPCYNFKIDCDE